MLHSYTNIYLSLSLSIIFAAALVMRIIPRRADDLHPLPRDNSIQDGNSIGLTFVPPRCFPARYSVLRHAHGTWNDIIGIIGRVGWVATMAHIYNSRVAARMWKLGRGVEFYERKKMEIISKGRRESISSYRPLAWDRGQPHCAHVISHVSWHLTLTRV